MPVDILAIAAHRDDVELTCAGTLIRAEDRGYRAGILDLTAGETGSRGSAALREEEAQRAAAVMGIHERRNAGLPDAHLQNSDEMRRVVVAELRHFRPRVVILPFPIGRHPDHRIAAELGRDACFLSGLARYQPDGEPHRPHKILHALSYREDPVKPTFVVDISEQFARKLAAIQCYGSQFDGAKAARISTRSSKLRTRTTARSSGPGMGSPISPTKRSRWTTSWPSRSRACNH
jgi:bacillithiol biosynthesis deacetylase BshB1